MKIALVHDYLVQYGGAERVLEVFSELFPDAPIYTLLYDKEAMHGVFSDRRIYPSALQKFPFAKKRHHLFPPFMPMSIERFDFSEFDVILSDSASYAKGALTKPGTLHICYMHTPTRYAWDDCQKYAQDFGFPRFVKKIVPFLMSPIRLWDRAAADRPDLVIANSKFVSDRIRKYYRRESDIIHPPVNTKNFYVAKPEDRKDYFLMVGRLIAYKRHDIAIEAFNRLKLPLKIIGRGPEIDRLKKLAGPTIEFLGRVSEKELPRYYAECRAFVFPQEEDFGIVAIEAMASGRPILAYRGGDIPEHLEEGKMGIFFDEQTPEAIMGAIETFRDTEYDPDFIRSKSLRFDREIFKEKIKTYIDEAFALHQSHP